MKQEIIFESRLVYGTITELEAQIQRSKDLEATHYNINAEVELDEGHIYYIKSIQFIKELSESEVLSLERDELTKRLAEIDNVL